MRRAFGKSSPGPLAGRKRQVKPRDAATPPRFMIGGKPRGAGAVHQDTALSSARRGRAAGSRGSAYCSCIRRCVRDPVNLILPPLPSTEGSPGSRIVSFRRRPGNPNRTEGAPAPTRAPAATAKAVDRRHRTLLRFRSHEAPAALSRAGRRERADRQVQLEIAARGSLRLPQAAVAGYLAPLTPRINRAPRHRPTPQRVHRIR